MVPEQDNRKEGLGAAVALAMDAYEPDQAAAQLPLLDLPVPDPRGEDVAADVATRGPGRPKGSKNKRTEDWAEYLLNHYRSPLEALAIMYSQPAVELKTALGCTLLEAVKLQIQAAKELAPYVHQKMPVAVEVDTKGVVKLIIQGPRPGDRVAVPGDAAIVIEGKIIEEEDATISDT